MLPHDDLPVQTIALPSVLTAETEAAFRDAKEAFYQAVDRLLAQRLVLLFQAVFDADPRIVSVRLDGDFSERVDTTVTLDAGDPPTPRRFEIPGISDIDQRLPGPVRRHVSADLKERLMALGAAIGGLNDGTLPRAVLQLWKTQAMGRDWTRDTLPALHRALATPEFYDPWKAVQDEQALQQTLPERSGSAGRAPRL